MSSSRPRPVIGVTTTFEPNGRVPERLHSALLAGYSDAVYAAGGLPLALLAPPEPDSRQIDQLLARCDGLLLSGGDDLPPTVYGQPAHPATRPMHARRARFELLVCQRADALGLPMLGTCLGHQLLHVARGGRLWQDLAALELTPRVRHHLEIDENTFHHVRVVPDSLLARVLGADRLETNSRHHQAVDPQQPGRDLRAVALADDGVIEASEDPRPGRFVLAVQWHPEDLIDRREHLALFAALVEAAQQRRAAR